MDTPVAPIGWPLAFSPPETIDRQLAVLLGPALRWRAIAAPFRGQAHRLVFDQLGDGEAVMRLDEGEIGRASTPAWSAPADQASARALEQQDVARAIGRKSCT
jgi:hypothetical protein